jgi:hypothetical protein
MKQCFSVTAYISSSATPPLLQKEKEKKRPLIVFDFEL